MAWFNELLTSNGLSFIRTAVEIALVFVMAKLCTSLVARVAKRAVTFKTKRTDELRLKHLNTAATITVAISKYVFFFIAIAITLGKLGLYETMTSMLAAAGIGGIAIGLGAQSLIGDIMSGVFMLFEDSLAIGDYVEIGGVSGTVESMSLRTTTIRGVRGELDIIPNGQIKQIKNYSRTDYLAFIDVSIAYEADVDRALEIMMDEAEKYRAEHGDDVTAPPEALGVMSLDPSGVTLRVTLRVKPLKHWGVQRELTRRVKERFGAQSIEIPYNKLVLVNK